MEYAERRCDQVLYVRSTVDSIWAWKPFFRVVRPSHTVVVRHELWPGFLFVAKKYGAVILLDGCFQKAFKGIKLWLKRKFLGYFELG